MGLLACYKFSKFYLSKKIDVEAVQSEKLTSLRGQDLYWVSLGNDQGMKVQVTNLGCIIQSILVPDREGVLRDVTLGFERVEEYFAPGYLADCPYFGAIVGRYANRVGRAQFEYEGNIYQLSKNNGENQLHGGGSFSHQGWQIKRVDPGNALVTFMLDSPNGDEGYPGNVHVEVTYQLTNNNDLIYHIEGTTDQPTPMNMTNHAYFNLHGDGGYAADHRIQIPAEKYFEQQEDLLVTGRLLPVAGTKYDFNIPRSVDQNWDPASGYDQAFLISKPQSEWGLIAKAYSERSGISLEVYSAEPVVQFYSGGFLDGIAGKAGHTYEKFGGFCFETHQHPNAINIPHFPDTIVKPGEVYTQKTTFKFGNQEF